MKRAQIKYGKKPLKGEEVRWGLENLAIDEAAIKKLGFDGFMTPISTTCADHDGGRTGGHPHLGRQEVGGAEGHATRPTSRSSSR